MSYIRQWMESHMEDPAVTKRREVARISGSRQQGEVMKEFRAQGRMKQPGFWKGHRFRVDYEMDYYLQGHDGRQGGYPADTFHLATNRLDYLDIVQHQTRNYEHKLRARQERAKQRRAEAEAAAAAAAAAEQTA